MTRVAFTGSFMFLALLALSPAPGRAADLAHPPPEDGTPYLVQMAGFARSLAEFEVTVDSGYDVVQPDGQKIEFLESRKVHVKRPKHVRVEFVQNDGSEGLLVFDGKQLGVSSNTDQVYATTETVGAIDEAVAFLTDRLGVRVPLAFLLSPDAPEQLPSRLEKADVVETRTLNGVVHRHIAARGKEADVQVWIPEGDKPLPSRIVITYRKEEGMPQFRADLRWNRSPEFSPSTFEFRPPPGAERVEFTTIDGDKASTGTQGKGRTR